MNKVFVHNKITNKYEEPYVGSYPITQLWTNENVTKRQVTIQERIKITCIKPYSKY